MLVAHRFFQLDAQAVHAVVNRGSAHPQELGRLGLIAPGGPERLGQLPAPAFVLRGVAVLQGGGGGGGRGHGRGNGAAA